jgi:hypothetical protein
VLHEQRANPAQERPCDPLLRELALGHEAHRVPQYRDEYEPIEVAGVVGYENRATLMRKPLGSRDAQRGSRQPEKRARTCAQQRPGA